MNAEQSSNRKNNAIINGAHLAIDLNFETVARTATTQSWLEITLERVHCVQQALRYNGPGDIIQTFTCTKSDCSNCAGESCEHFRTTVSNSAAAADMISISDCRYGDTVMFEKFCCERQFFNKEIAIIGKEGVKTLLKLCILRD